MRERACTRQQLHQVCVRRACELACSDSQTLEHAHARKRTHEYQLGRRPGEMCKYGLILRDSSLPSGKPKFIKLDRVFDSFRLCSRQFTSELSTLQVDTTVILSRQSFLSRQSCFIAHLSADSPHQVVNS